VCNHAPSRRAPRASHLRRGTRLDTVVLFYELALVLCTVVITWFALYALYRLITDES